MLRESGFFPRHPEGIVGTPEQIASTAVWLCTPGAEWVSGLSLFVNGGTGAF